MTYDVAAVRAHFPALQTGTAHFDGPGGTQVPDAVARAVAETLTSPIANRGQVTAAERLADDVVRDARQALADLLGADPRGVVLGRSATQLTFDVSRALSAGWGPGDEVVVSRLDHDANVRPWVIAAGAVGATVRLVPFDPATGELTVDDVTEVLTERTTLVAVTGASNLIGTRPPVAAIAERAHAVGALLAVDGVHLTAHAPVDVRALGADLYTCSPYKFLGRTAACWPRILRCWSRSRRRSCFPRPTTSRSASSWAPCRTSSWPGRRRRSTSSPVSLPGAAAGGSGCSPRWRSSRSTRTACASTWRPASRPFPGCGSGRAPPPGRRRSCSRSTGATRPTPTASSPSPA